jgi:hypothetical protein
MYVCLSIGSTAETFHLRLHSVHLMNRLPAFLVSFDMTISELLFLYEIDSCQTLLVDPASEEALGDLIVPAHLRHKGPFLLAPLQDRPRAYPRKA